MKQNNSNPKIIDKIDRNEINYKIILNRSYNYQ